MQQTVSGGIHARRGFTYQDIVVLDLLMAHFDQHGPSSSVRPEGIDDLELVWNTSDGNVQKRFVQVKKPREDAATNPTGAPWTLADVTRELIPGALFRMKGNIWEQHWILGDGLCADARSLLAAGNDAATQVPRLYWLTVHRLARPTIPTGESIEGSTRRLLMKWRPRPEFITTPNRALSDLLEDFGTKLEKHLSVATAREYQRSVNQTHAILLDVLARIRVRAEFGPESQVANRVKCLLHHRYNLDAAIVDSTLLPNLRGFVNDVSTIPGR